MCTQGQPGRDPRHQGSHRDTGNLRQHTPGAVKHLPQGELVQGQDKNPSQPARCPHKGADSRPPTQGQLPPEANGHQGPKTVTKWHCTQENTLDFHHLRCCYHKATWCPSGDRHLQPWCPGSTPLPAPWGVFCCSHHAAAVTSPRNGFSFSHLL